MTTEKLNYLLEKRYAGLLTEAEEQELEQWYWQMQHENEPLFDGKDPVREELIKLGMTNNIMFDIEQIHFKEKRSRRIHILRKWTIAAAIVVVIATSFLIFDNKNPRITSDNNISASVYMKDTLSLETLKNTGTGALTHYFEDGSKIILFSNSEITYPTHFTRDRRDVFLKGKSFFSVAGNPKRPFRVHSGNITTTALGTSFTITSYNHDSMVNVRLHKGSVVVGSGIEKKMKPVYLRPGDEIIINTHTFLALTNPVKKAVAKDNSASSKQSIYKPQSISFDREIMSHVLDTLAAHYNIRIIYNQIEIKDLDFSGVVRLTDSPVLILQRIALLNDLLVKTTQKGYIISKN